VDGPRAGPLYAGGVGDDLDRPHEPVQPAEVHGHRSYAVIAAYAAGARAVDLSDVDLTFPIDGLAPAAAGG
jgi:hypothetical protein